jgi:hypothetical protein
MMTAVVGSWTLNRPGDLLNSLALAARTWSVPGGWVAGHRFAEAGIAERRLA